MSQRHPSLVRAGGVLLHPTSLPSAFGIGDLGGSAYRWLDWLNRAGCALWQVLPLGPTGYGDSPYQSFSSFAGNPLLIAPDQLIDEGLLLADDLEPMPEAPTDQVAYGDVIPYRRSLLGKAVMRFQQGAIPALVEQYHTFCETNAAWLDDFALFMAMKQAHKGAVWTSWEPDIAARQPDALAAASETYKSEMEFEAVLQFLVFRQWNLLRTRAAELGIRIIGDIPIFVAHDSADVWAHQRLFSLDESGMPTHVAGVPPDYFSVTGQRWGNPLYQWDRMKAEGFHWWMSRFDSVLSMVDLVRLDHFRGFEAYWEIPVESPTAEQGRWVPAPGDELLDLLQQRHGDLPIIAEDLGVITPEVEALRNTYNLPGMKILQFAFEGRPDDDFLPHHYPPRCVVYTGTHDNDTSKGWFDKAEDHVQDFCRRYLASDGDHIAWDMIRSIWASVAERVIAPMQDFLELGSAARMNFPGQAQGNWKWRLTGGQISSELADRVHELNYLYDRLVKTEEQKQ